jgi:hypothetical protein
MPHRPQARHANETRPTRPMAGPWIPAGDTTAPPCVADGGCFGPLGMRPAATVRDVARTPHLAASAARGVVAGGLAHRSLQGPRGAAWAGPENRRAPSSRGGQDSPARPCVSTRGVPGTSAARWYRPACGPSPVAARHPFWRETPAVAPAGVFFLPHPLARAPGLSPAPPPQNANRECQPAPLGLAFFGAGGVLRPRSRPKWARSHENCSNTPPSDEPRVGILGGREGSRPHGGPRR